MVWKSGRDSVDVDMLNSQFYWIIDISFLQQRCGWVQMFSVWRETNYTNNSWAVNEALENQDIKCGSKLPRRTEHEGLYNVYSA